MALPTAAPDAGQAMAEQGNNSLLLVSGLPDGMDEATLRTLFERCGTITALHVVQGQRYAFVKFVSKDEAQVAIDSVNNFAWSGSVLAVQFAPSDAALGAGMTPAESPGALALATPPDVSIGGASESTATGNDNLYVKGLPLGLTDTAVHQVFSVYGTVMQCRVLQASHATETVAMVRMGSSDQAAWLVQNLNGNIPQGLTEPVSIKFADPPGAKKQGGYGPELQLGGSLGSSRFSPYPTATPGVGATAVGYDAVAAAYGASAVGASPAMIAAYGAAAPAYGVAAPAFGAYGVSPQASAVAQPLANPLGATGGADPSAAVAGLNVLVQALMQLQQNQQAGQLPASFLYPGLLPTAQLPIASLPSLALQPATLQSAPGGRSAEVSQAIEFCNTCKSTGRRATDDEIKWLVEVREKARMAKDFSSGDALRDALLNSLGISLREKEKRWSSTDGRNGQIPLWNNLLAPSS